MKLREKLRQFDKVRRQKLVWIEKWFYKAISLNRKPEKTSIDKKEIKKILIVRNNKRIGNVLFLIPFVDQTIKIYPDAKIDLILMEPWQGQFFDGLKINKILYSKLRMSGILNFTKTIRTANKENYDLILCPFGSSTDTIISGLISSRNKVSSYDNTRSSIFPNSNQYDEKFTHTAYKPLSILEAMGNKLHFPIKHHITLSSDEKIKGIVDANRLKVNINELNVAFFRGARGKKRLSDATWNNILDRIESVSKVKVNWIEILSKDLDYPLRQSDCRTFYSEDMRHLGSVLRHWDGFICCDTGPLHLADAVGATCIGLFTETNINDFGTLGSNSINIQGLEKLDEKTVFEKLYNWQTI